MNRLIASNTVFLSPSDEASFFARVKDLQCVLGVKGEGRTIVITLRRAPTEIELRELIAVFFRYHVDLKQLAQFSEHEAWLKDTRGYWYRGMFE